MPRKNRPDLYQEITDKIVAKLEAGDLPPWRLPIRQAGGDPLPRNLITNAAYRGINYWLLLLQAWDAGYDRPIWLTFRQAKERDARVRKGERGTRVIFWKQYEKSADGDHDAEEKHVVSVIKHYTVFNVAQIDGLQLPPASELTIDPFEPLAAAERIVEGFVDGPEIVVTGSRGAYLPQVDRVEIAEASRFETPEAYYATLFHELVHSTGHSRRLGRGLDKRLAPFGSPDYSREELVAEMGSAYLCAVAGISQPTLDPAAAYLDGWLRKFRDDKKLIIQAAGHAQRAVDRVLGIEFAAAKVRHQGPTELDMQPTAAPSAPRPIQHDAAQAASCWNGMQNRPQCGDPHTP